MSFGETLYYLMYELLSPFGMESSDADKNKWALFPFGDLTDDDKNAIQAAFEGVLQEIVTYLSENGLTIADLMENGEWKTGNEDFIGLLSQLAGTMNATYNSADGMILFADSTSSNDVFPFVAVAETATDTKYLINGSTLSAIGDAIRAKEGTTETYSPTTMAQKITDDLVKPSGTFQIKNAQQVDVSSYQYAKVMDDNLAAENIKKDVTILGVTGTHEGASTPSLQSKSVTYAANGTATITPDDGYDGLSSVDVTVNVSGLGAISGGNKNYGLDSPSFNLSNCKMKDFNFQNIDSSFFLKGNVILENIAFVGGSVYISNSNLDNLMLSLVMFNGCSVTCSQTFYDAFLAGDNNSVDTNFDIVE